MRKVVNQVAKKYTTIAFYNNKGGVGKTTLAYHLAHLYAAYGLKALVVDLDPQSNLTVMCLQKKLLTRLWGESHERDITTIWDALTPLVERTGDIAMPQVVRLGDNLHLLPGTLALGKFEGLLSDSWMHVGFSGDIANLRVTTAIHRIVDSIAQAKEVDLVLLDLAPNMGALNRASLLSADHVVVPLVPDLFSVQGLKNLGPTIRDWRGEWQTQQMIMQADCPFSLPSGAMNPIGYVALQHNRRNGEPVKAYNHWSQLIPDVYQKHVLGTPSTATGGIDPNKLGDIKHYRSLMPYAMKAKKPMFFLSQVDGILGGHVNQVGECLSDFKQLALAIADHTPQGLALRGAIR